MRSTAGTSICTDDYRGEWLILAFSGATDDVTGRRLFRQLRGAYRLLRRNGARLVAVAPLEVDLRRLVDPGLYLPFAVLVDPNGEVHRRFGAVDWSGSPAASVFIVNRRGVVVFRALGGLGEDLPTPADVIAAIQLDELTTLTPPIYV